MSEIEQLVASLCPDGVEYKALGEICKISNGKDHKHLKDGSFPVYGSGGIMRYVDSYIYREPSVLIPRKGSIGNLFYLDEPFWTVDTIFYTKINGNAILPKFMYYYLSICHIEDLNTAGGVPSLTKTVLDRIQIPIPPLPIQEEIVRILDAFTTLEAELEAELEARKKQYEYYRDELLSFGDDVEWKKIEDTCIKVTSGGTPNTARSDYYGGNIPWLRTQEVDWIDIIDTGVKITDEGLQNSSAQWIPKNCVVVAMYGATAAKVAINKIPMTTNQACCNLQVDEKIVMYRYMFHWLSNQYIKLRKLGQGSQSNINAKTVRNFPIPVPPLSEQARIVEILDRFDALTNDITQGLPAELAARRKQYEYYRDKLLSFKEKVS